MRVAHVLPFCLLFLGCRSEPSAPVPAATASADPNTVSASPSASSSASTTEPVKAEAAKAFWTWFAASSSAVASIKTGAEPIANTLADELHKVDPDLTFELGINGPTREMIVSADGKKATFPAVKALVAAAPALPGWKVIAFRPRKPGGLTIEMGGTMVDPKDIWFRAAPDPGRSGLIELTLFVKGLTPENEKAVESASFLVLDSTLGEYDVEMKIGAISTKPAPAAPSEAGLRPLNELPPVVDDWK